MRPTLEATMPRRIERILMSRHIFLRLISTTVALVVIFGVLISVLDREEFPSIWLGMWWAIGTVTTVGYGDVVPAATSGRIIASAVMIVGIAFLSLITATVASTLVSRGAARTSSADADVLAVLERVERRLERLERKVGAAPER
jgi:voltage-gated potassium channel